MSATSFTRMTQACNDEKDHPLCEYGIEQQNERLPRQYREFLRAADTVTAAWWAHPEVIAVSLFVSMARTPWKDVLPFGPFGCPPIALCHECKDLVLAL